MKAVRFKGMTYSMSYRFNLANKVAAQQPSGQLIARMTSCRQKISGGKLGQPPLYFLRFGVWTVRDTVDIPSTNLVRKSTLALLNIPSFRETTMNWELLKWVLSMLPMFCVWLRSRAASTSSKILGQILCTRKEIRNICLGHIQPFIQRNSTHCIDPNSEPAQKISHLFKYLWFMR